MKKILPLMALILQLSLHGCQKKQNNPETGLIEDLQLKRGEIVTCTPSGQQFGAADFEISAAKHVQKDFNLAIQLLHSFEYDEAEKVFARIIDEDPSCAMAYWGVAMSNFHPLWTPPTERELIKGEKAIRLAQSLKASPREASYIDAMAIFYHDWNNVDHKTRCLNFERKMESIFQEYPTDHEAAIFYCLALNAAVDPGDKTFSRQIKAGNILRPLYANQPDHPGIVHYLIHTYDYPDLAQEGLEPARRYASIAPSSAHALHMPSHIFTRLGLWDECIQSNLESTGSARCYAEQTGIKGHWDEELHGLDYLVYAYLQKGDNDAALQQCEYLQGIREVYPVNFKVAYAFAAIPARYALENRHWSEASRLPVAPADLPWQNFPWQQAIIHFARLLGFVHTDKLDSARQSLAALNSLHRVLLERKDAYQANQVEIQIKSGEAWIAWKEGKRDLALSLMEKAADMEDKSEKHPVTPSEVVPARELLGDLYAQYSQPAVALVQYEAVLKKHPNTFNALYGAGQAAEKSGDLHKANKYYQQLLDVVGPSAHDQRAEIIKAREFRSGSQSKVRG